jgi:hypothetical protein
VIGRWLRERGVGGRGGGESVENFFGAISAMGRSARGHSESGRGAESDRRVMRDRRVMMNASTRSPTRSICRRHLMNERLSVGATASTFDARPRACPRATAASPQVFGARAHRARAPQ